MAKALDDREAPDLQHAQAFLDAYRGAVLARDVDALMALYHTDVCVFDAWDKWVFEGAERWREVVVAWLGSLGEERVAVTFDAVRIRGGLDLTALHAFVRYAALSPSGAELRALVDRHSWVLERRDGAWRVVHEHASAPIDFRTKRAMLGRPSSAPG